MPENEGLTTFDDFSMETSKGFLNALQELKNLRPQLYSAADYSEKSYLHNEQKQMVLDNLKDYTLQVLVNAVDHLGTVACKLNDLFQHQAFDISTTELRISCLNQQLLACQMYTDKGGLRQQQLFLTVPQHHKHYILPNTNSRNKKAEAYDGHKWIDNMRAKHAKAKPRPHPSAFMKTPILQEQVTEPFIRRSNGASPGPNPKTTCTTTMPIQRDRSQSKLAGVYEYRYQRRRHILRESLEHWHPHPGSGRVDRLDSLAA
ncbi:hypothetical protein ACLOJK_010077 [Asimina triloba]